MNSNMNPNLGFNLNYPTYAHDDPKSREAQCSDSDLKYAGDG